MPPKPQQTTRSGTKADTAKAPTDTTAGRTLKGAAGTKGGKGTKAK